MDPEFLSRSKVSQKHYTANSLNVIQATLQYSQWLCRSCLPGFRCYTPVAPDAGTVIDNFGGTLLDYPCVGRHFGSGDPFLAQVGGELPPSKLPALLDYPCVNATLGLVTPFGHRWILCV